MDEQNMQALEPEAREHENRAESAPETTGLRGIVLVDSYIAGECIEVVIDGHTGVTGRNSIGKTTFLRLLPLFYGAEPRQVVSPSPSEGVQSIARHYLPRDGSYIIYQYNTQEGPQLAVLVNGNRRENEIRHVLVSGDYRADLFVDNDGRFLPSAELGKRAKADGRAVEYCQGFSDYREIVFGDSRRRSRKNFPRQFNVLSGLATADKRVSLQPLHQIINQVSKTQINKKGAASDLDERLLCRLLVEQAQRSLEERQYRTGNLHLNIDPDDLSQWIGNYRGLCTLLEKMESGQAAITASRELADLNDHLINLRVAMQRRYGTLSADRDDQQSKVEEANRGIAAVDHRRDEQGQQFQADRNWSATQWNHAANELKGLDDRLAKIRSEGLEEARREAPRLDSYKHSREDAEQRREVLTSGARHIDQEIDRAIQEVRNKAEQQRSRIDDEREKGQAAYQKRHSELSPESVTLADECR